MSLLAIAIARDLGLDIVTHEQDVHEDLLNKNAAGVLAEFLGSASEPAEPAKDDIADDICQVALITGFDLQGLSARMIADLANDGQDLRRSKQAVDDLAQSIPAIRDPKVRRERVEYEAARLLDQWESYRRGLPARIANALIDFRKELSDLPALVAGGYVVAGRIGVGLGVVAFLARGLRGAVRDYREHPFHYLSRIQTATERSVGILTVSLPREEGSAFPARVPL